jgi:competence protein ComEC
VPTAGKAIELIAVPAIDAMIWLVKNIAELDISEVVTGYVSFWAIAVYYLLILLAGYAYFRKPLAKVTLCGTLCCLAVAGVASTRVRTACSDALILTALDVGHGQAVVAQLPGGRNLVLDAGSLATGDIGRRIVVPFLRYAGISSVDAVVLTHTDIDHYNGAAEIIADGSVGAVYAGEDFVRHAEERGAERMLRDYLAANSLAIRTQFDELDRGSPARIETVWPPEEIRDDSVVEDNDKSIVLRIQYAGCNILLCSDILKFSQQEMLRRNPALKADVIVAPHHGSSVTLARDFIEKLEPTIVICSCGSSSYEKKLVARPRPGVSTFYTASGGAIRVTVSRDGEIRAAYLKTKAN